MGRDRTDLAELAEWRDVERVVLEEVWEQTAAVVVALSDEHSAESSALETVCSLLRVALPARYMDEPFPAPPSDPQDEDVVLDAYADRLAVFVDWLPRESSWRGCLRTNLRLLDSLAERGED